MANIKISELLESLQLKDDDVLVIVQDATTKKITVANARKLLKGQDGVNGTNGADGEDGATFTPTVSEEGDLSWTNNKNLENPQTVNIKGPKGDTGEKGQDGANGTNGADGEDGATFTPTVSEEGVLSWTNNKNLENPQTVNIKGPKGDTGEKGQDGISVNCIKVSSEEEAISQSTVNPNNIYYW